MKLCADIHCPKQPTGCFFVLWLFLQHQVHQLHKWNVNNDWMDAHGIEFGTYIHEVCNSRYIFEYLFLWPHTVQIRQESDAGSQHGSGVRRTRSSIFDQLRCGTWLTFNMLALLLCSIIVIFHVSNKHKDTLAFYLAAPSFEHNRLNVSNLN